MIPYSFGDTLLKTENVSYSIDGKLILRDINVEIKDIIVPGRTTGQIVGCLGPSGRGKTTLFKLLAGLNEPTAGSIMVGDVEKGQSHKVKAGDVGVVYQNYPLFEHRTVWSNLAMVFHKSETKTQIKEKIEYYLNRFNLLEQKDKYPAQLSGGQKQRIAILQQLLCSDHYLLLDEPFSGLDPLMTHEVCVMLQEIADLDEENTLIIVSHDIHSTLAVSDIVWLLGNDFEEKDGKKVAIPGARIKYQQNLMDLGLTWNPAIVNDPAPEFLNLEGEIRNLYNDL